MERGSPTWSRGEGEKPKVFSHRGNTGGGRAFENTLSAFDAAARSGAAGIEIDVSRTRDGRLVCFHDPTLKRISGGDVPVTSAPFSAIRAIPLEGGERVPTLDEAFEVIPAGLPVILDLKTDGVLDRPLVSKVVRLLKRLACDGERELTVTSFNYYALALLAAMAPHLRAGLLVRPSSIHTRIGMSRPLARRWKAVHPQHTMVRRARVERWHAAGLTVLAWTVNDPKEAARCAAEGVDGLISDNPQLLLSSL